MKTASAMLFLLAASGGLAAADDEAVAKELKALAGSYKLVSAEEGGKAVPKGDFHDLSLTLSPDGKATLRTPDGEVQTRYVIDPAKTPKALDVEFLSGALKGQTEYGIYKAEGGRWTVCSAPPVGKPEVRPREFDSKAGKGFSLFVWERVKEEKKP